MSGSDALVRAVVARLEGGDPPAFGEVVPALDLEAVAGNADRLRLPAAAVALAGDEADPAATTSSGAVLVVAATLAVVLAVEARNVRAGAEPERVRRGLSDSIDEVRRRLVGWRPEGCMGPVTLLRGQLLEIESGLAVWAEEYRVRRTLAGGHVIGGSP